MHQWCRCGVICDSEVRDFKYLLEITEDGVEEYELFSRLLMLKKQNKTVGYKAMARSYRLDPEQQSELDHIRKELKGKTWSELLKLEKKDDKKYKETLKLFFEATEQTKLISNTLNDDTFLYSSLFKVF